MRKFILLIAIPVFSTAVIKAQKTSVTPPEKGDYVCLNSCDSGSYHFIFKKSILPD